MTLDKHLTPIAAAVGAAALALLVWVNFAVGAGENGGLGPFLVTAVVALVVWAFVFGWYAPRAQSPARAGLVASLLGLVSVAAFWSALPLLLGAAGIVFGVQGAPAARRIGLAAVALGSLAIALTIGATVYDALA